MGFIFDRSKATTNDGIKPEGDYECIIESVGKNETRSGKTSIHFQLRIRKDIDGQNYGGACLFYDIWKKREPTECDKSVGGYNYGHLMAVGVAAQLEEKEYKSVREYLDEMEGKPVRATVKHEEYNGKTYEKVSKLSPTKSNVKPAPEAAAEADVFDDDGVPF